ncbi:hypothetical protein GGX14DRAFT_387728 [Mycena pura]|uniref:Uncharacterized protein n=1 Tax=Mycena pura TaxID=153505 RepID=A0AAD6YM19_9AGAR|nr:hypothetical protein GGX14DRAFT_387728 [Mycena pura]
MSVQFEFAPILTLGAIACRPRPPRRSSPAPHPTGTPRTSPSASDCSSTSASPSSAETPPRHAHAPSRSSPRPWSALAVLPDHEERTRSIPVSAASVARVLWCGRRREGAAAAERGSTSQWYCAATAGTSHFAVALVTRSRIDHIPWYFAHKIYIHSPRAPYLSRVQLIFVAYPHNGFKCIGQGLEFGKEFTTPYGPALGDPCLSGQMPDSNPDKFEIFLTFACVKSRLGNGTGKPAGIPGSTRTRTRVPVPAEIRPANGLQHAAVRLPVIPAGRLLPTRTRTRTGQTRQPVRVPATRAVP